MSSSPLAIRSAPQPPIVPAALAARMVDYSGMDVIRGKVPAEIVQQAVAVLPNFDAFLAPASPATIEDWLRKLRCATATMGDQDFDGRVAAIKIASGDLPAWVWCKEALVDAMRTCRFFPTAAEVDAMLEPRARAARHRAWVARQLASATPMPEISGESSQPLPSGF